MKPDLGTPRAVSDAAANQETGKTLEQWFEVLDRAGGPPQGRSALGKLLQGEHKLDAWWVTTVTVEYERARGLVEKDGRPKGYANCVTRTIDAAPERVFDGFASAPALDRWLGARHQAEVAAGGELANADGNRGTFTKVTRPKTIKLAWSDPAAGNDTLVEVLFQPKGAKTGLVLNHTRIQTRAEADALRAAWDGSLAALKAWAEAT